MRSLLRGTIAAVALTLAPVAVVTTSSAPAHAAAEVATTSSFIAQLAWPWRPSCQEHVASAEYNDPHLHCCACGFGGQVRRDRGSPRPGEGHPPPPP